MSENIETTNKIIAIVQKHLSVMFEEIWNVADEKTKERGNLLVNAENDLTKIILNELTAINVIN